MSMFILIFYQKPLFIHYVDNMNFIKTKLDAFIFLMCILCVYTLSFPTLISIYKGF